MTGLNLFGLFAVSVMVTCYALENRGAFFILAFALSCLLASAYGFLQGAWPFGILEAVWSVIALKRWRTALALTQSNRLIDRTRAAMEVPKGGSRI